MRHRQKRAVSGATLPAAHAFHVRAVGEEVQGRHLHQLIIGGQHPGIAGQGGRVARDVDQALRSQMEQGLQGFRGHTAGGSSRA